MDRREDRMVEFEPEAVPTSWVEFERSLVTAERVRNFVRGAAGTEDGVPRDFETAPLTFALLLRRGHGPEAKISPRAFGIHGGHDIELHAPIRVGETYTVRARVERVFRKTGRSGAMTIVERRVHIHDGRDTLASEITDRQIVRWKPTASSPRTKKGPPPSHPHPPASASGGLSTSSFDPNLEVGEILGPFRRRGPKRVEISRWADALRDRETLFHDRDGSHALGYADLVVPGPMQSAVVDHLLRAKLPDWQTTRLNMTFRQSLLASEALEIEGVVVDSEGDARTLEILIRNADSGETASVGTATLTR